MGKKPTLPPGVLEGIYKGTRYYEALGKWYAIVPRPAPRPDMQLGPYEIEEQAAVAYNTAVKLYGLAVPLNDVDKRRLTQLKNGLTPVQKHIMGIMRKAVSMRAVQLLACVEDTGKWVDADIHKGLVKLIKAERLVLDAEHGVVSIPVKGKPGRPKKVD